MNLSSRIRKSASLSLNEGTFDAPVKFARADMVGAEQPIEEKNWSEAAKIYVKNALKRLKEKNPDLDDEKLKKRVSLGLGSTFLKGGHAWEIKVGKITLGPDDAENFKKAVKKELGIKTKADKKTEKVKEKSDKDSKDFTDDMKPVKESFFVQYIHKNAGL